MSFITTHWKCPECGWKTTATSDELTNGVPICSDCPDQEMEPFDPETETVFLDTKDGNTISIQFNKTTGRLVVDLVAKDDSGGNEIVNMIVDEKKMLNHVGKK